MVVHNTQTDNRTGRHHVDQPPPLRLYMDLILLLILIHHLFLAILGVHSVDVITRVKPVFAKARPEQHAII